MSLHKRTASRKYFPSLRWGTSPEFFDGDHLFVFSHVVEGICKKNTRSIFYFTLKYSLTDTHHRCCSISYSEVLECYSTGDSNPTTSRPHDTQQTEEKDHLHENQLYISLSQLNQGQWKKKIKKRKRKEKVKKEGIC